MCVHQRRKKKKKPEKRQRQKKTTTTENMCSSEEKKKKKKNPEKNICSSKNAWVARRPGSRAAQFALRLGSAQPGSRCGLVLLELHLHLFFFSFFFPFPEFFLLFLRFGCLIIIIFGQKSSLRDSISMQMPHRKSATSDVNNP